MHAIVCTEWCRKFAVRVRIRWGRSHSASCAQPLYAQPLYLHSVALYKGNYGIFRSGVQLYTRASGHARLEGLQVPSDEVE